jgi:peptidoglycan LD-endopeptidase LytH
MTPRDANGVLGAMSSVRAHASQVGSLHRPPSSPEVPLTTCTSGHVRKLLTLLMLAALPVAAACNAREALDRFRPATRTAHERYARSLHDAGLDSTAMGREWLAASDSALRAPLAASLPAREAGVYTRSEARAVAYRFALTEGQRLQASLQLDGPAARMFVDLFEVTGDSARPFEHRRTADSVLVADSGRVRVGFQYEATRSGTYVLRLQPELLRGGKFELTLRTEPILAFPVKGGSNRSVQSFFGAVRDGGRRDHHGIDIFAPRGTPVVASANGIVRSISPNALGGNVVWLSDVDRGQTLYYAHLDRHAVSTGQQVQIGDVLGYVGNTGNARTTAPHLHFGIYRRGRGPIDPLPYVRISSASPPRISGDPDQLGSHALTRVPLTDIRGGPSPESALVRRVSRETPLQVMGASGAWFRVQLEDGTAGYVTAGALRVVRNADPRELGS